MTALERYRTVIEGGRLDFCPRVPILMLFAAGWIGRDYADDIPRNP